MKLANLQNGGLRKLVLGIPFSVVRSSFASRIPHVIGVRASKQVGRIHAGRTVACVTHTQPIGYRAVRQEPSNSVGGRGCSGSADVKCPIPFDHCGSFPQPALSVGANVSPTPKALDLCGGHGWNWKVDFGHHCSPAAGLFDKAAPPSSLYHRQRNCASGKGIEGSASVGRATSGGKAPSGPSE